MTTLQDEFEAWFQAVELGDGEAPLPQPKDGKRWDEYVMRHALALSAVQWATERTAKKCEELGSELSRQWKAGHKTNAHLEGQSDGCFDCAAAIRARDGKGATG